MSDPPDYNKIIQKHAQWKVLGAVQNKTKNKKDNLKLADHK